MPFVVARELPDGAESRPRVFARGRKCDVRDESSRRLKRRARARASHDSASLRACVRLIAVIRSRTTSRRIGNAALQMTRTPAADTTGL